MTYYGVRYKGKAGTTVFSWEVGLKKWKYSGRGNRIYELNLNLSVQTNTSLFDSDVEALHGLLTKIIELIEG